MPMSVLVVIASQTTRRASRTAGAALRVRRQAVPTLPLRSLIDTGGSLDPFTAVIHAPGDVLYDRLKSLGVTDVVPSVLTPEFASKTAAFALATLISLAWNFSGYPRWVFRTAPEPGRSC